jgi:hypothetical protein
MKSTHILPTVMIVLSLGAAVFYAFAHNIRMTIYWTASAVIIASVTF